MHYKLKKFSQAHTLFEFLITLSLMIILASLSGLALRTFFVRLQVDQLQHNLQSLLIYARTQALIREDSIKLCPSLDNQQCQEISQHEWRGSLLLTHAAHVLMLKPSWPSFIHLYWFSGLNANEALSFKRDGGIGMQQGSFLLCPEPPYHYLARAVVILQSGRLRVTNDYSKLASHCSS